MAFTPAQIIQAVSTSPLNDQESSYTYIRWPITELLGFLNEALIEIGNYRPDAFSVVQDITLTAGAQQALPSGMSVLKSLNYSGSSSLCPGAPITQADLELTRTFYKKPCLPTGGASDYRVRNYSYDAKDPLVFYVSPPVPAGNTTTVTASLVSQPVQYTSGTINDTMTIDPKYYNAIKFWMTARAFEVDTESATSQTESDKFYKKFYNLLGVQYSQQSKHNSGTYLGQGGDNRMTKQRVP